ncbi:hypothetical protein BB561_004889 [Smittium simulii]|uniref:Ergosterol biosynthesis protein n=1 Tax=Smittium simulii TaxID=133385 RepID=A0A2T9YDL3_9FUNG|nr:hypothetical protein BB561_004889 [Smittium simulii]
MPIIPAGGLAKLIFTSAILSIFNSAQCMLAPLGLTRRIYNGQNQQVTPLSSHTFAAWTILSAIIRYQCSFNMNNQILYDITLSSYIIAACHFLSEIYVFKTTKLFGPVLSTFVVAGTSIFWMIKDRALYI